MGKCKLWKTCPNYQPGSRACNNDDEALGTCGIRKEGGRPQKTGEDRIATLDFVITVLRQHEKALDNITEKLELLLAKEPVKSLEVARIIGKMEAGKELTPKERHMLLSYLRGQILW